MQLFTCALCLFHNDSMVFRQLRSNEGSGVAELQELAVNLFNLSKQFNIALELRWVPREENTGAEALSKYVDTGDWELTQYFFGYIEK